MAALSAVTCGISIAHPKAL